MNNYKNSLTNYNKGKCFAKNEGRSTVYLLFNGSHKRNYECFNFCIYAILHPVYFQFIMSKGIGSNKTLLQPCMPYTLTLNSDANSFMPDN